MAAEEGQGAGGIPVGLTGKVLAWRPPLSAATTSRFKSDLVAKRTFDRAFDFLKLALGFLRGAVGAGIRIVAVLLGFPGRLVDGALGLVEQFTHGSILFVWCKPRKITTHQPTNRFITDV